MKKAEFTAFLSIVFILVFSFIFGMLDIINLKTSKNLSRLTVDGALFSLFGEYDTSLLKEYSILGIDEGYGTDQQEEQNLIDKLHYYGDSQIEHKITAIQYLTDQSGHAYREQVIKAMEEKYGIDFIRKYIERIPEWEESDHTIEEMRQNEESIIEQYEEINQSDEKLEENPFTCLETIEKTGLLSVVMPKEMELSGLQILENMQPSNRNLNSGRGTLPIRQNLNGIEERLLFHEYLLKQFSNAAMDQRNMENNEDIDKDLNYEMEYILAGKKSDKENLESVLMQIFLIRMALNYAFLMGDSLKQSEASTLAITISTLLLIPEASEGLKQLIILAWAVGESVIDLRTLLAGNQVPTIKNTENWQLTLSSLFTLGNGSEQLDGMDVSEGMTYEDYLRGLLFLKSDDEITMRSLDRIESNIKKMTGNENFKVDHCVTKLELENKMEVFTNTTYIFPAYFGYE